MYFYEYWPLYESLFQPKCYYIDYFSAPDS